MGHLNKRKVRSRRGERTFSATDAKKQRKLPDTPDTLSTDFDALLARMQAARARARMKAAFGASPKALGKAAVQAAAIRASAGR